jgi:GT2 family glycosyltransferase
MVPLVSVILPTYRRADALPDCLDGLERQTHPAMEVVIVDQSPDDGTRAVVAARRTGASRLRYLHSDVAGASVARNLGMRAASGSVFAFTDDDAIPEPRWIEALVRAFEASPADVVGGKILPLWEGARPAWFPDSRAYLVGIFDPGGPLARFPRESLPMTGNLAVRREVMERLGGFDEGAGPRPGRPISGEDSLFAWKAIEAGLQVYYQPEAIVHHRVPRNRMTRKHYLRRSYLEGVSLVDVEERRGILTAERIAQLLDAHRRIRRARWLAALGRVSLAPWRDPRLLSHLGEAALSAGIVSSCRRVLRERAHA